MFWRQNETKVDIINQADVENYFYCNSAVLIEVVNGKAALKVQSMYKDDSYYGSRSISVLTLNGNPLIQKDVPGCLTCAGLLAT